MIKSIPFLLLCIGLLMVSSCDNSGKTTASDPATASSSDETSTKAENSDNQPSPPAPISESDAALGLLTITGDKVNVRAQPNQSASKVAQLNNGDKAGRIGQSSFVETVGKHTDFWYEIEFDGKEGWIFGAFTNQKLSEKSRTDKMKFLYTEFGDYYHLVFSWADESNSVGHGWKCERYGMEADGTWDFGYGSQFCDLSGYQLDSDEEGTTNPEFEGKVFEVEWMSKMSTPWEGGGSMETVEMEIPIIVGLKLVN